LQECTTLSVFGHMHTILFRMKMRNFFFVI
jgi:hypothetical protein